MINSAPWVYTPEGKRTLILPKKCSNGDVVAHLMKERGVPEGDEESFLHPSPDDLTSWNDWPALKEGVHRLLSSVARGESIHIHADYDVDGISSCVILRAVLQALGSKITFSLPNRFKEGYGIHPAHVDEAVGNGAKLLVTLDNGSTAGKVMGKALDEGLEVQIYDHHRPDELPEGLHLCNPEVDAPPGCRELATAGIVLKLCEGLVEESGLNVSRESLLRMACLGTLCDQVPLTMDNRIIAALGLKALEHPTNPFLSLLFRRCRISGVPSVTDITFRVGPRINAVGRLGDACDVVDYFFLREPDAVRDAVEKVDKANRSRRLLQEEVIKGALDHGEDLSGAVVAFDPSWHFGVLGIAAARVAQETGKPAILFSRVNGMLRGSGRSVPGLDLHDFLLPLSTLMESFGGHAQAVGLTLREDNLNSFVAEVERRSRNRDLSAPGSFHLDAVISLDDLTPDFLQVLAAFGPHGRGNRPFTFYAPFVTTRSTPQPMGKGHLRMTFSGKHLSFPAVFWDGEACPPLPAECGIIFAVETYRGTRRLNLKGYHSQ